MHRALKETQDQLGLQDPKGIRVSKDSQVSQDCRVHQVPPANLEEKGPPGPKLKREMMGPGALRDHPDHQVVLAPQD